MSAECEALAEVDAKFSDNPTRLEYEESEPGEDDGATSSLDLILDLLFQRCTLRELEGISERRATLRRMWKSTFGRLPPTSDLALRYAPNRQALGSRVPRPVPPRAFQGRLLVPLPSTSNGRISRASSVAPGWTKLN
eukprot:scaffold8374_cov36-Tisochrysis_lutea.AAC.3